MRKIFIFIIIIFFNSIAFSNDNLQKYNLTCTNWIEERGGNAWMIDAAKGKKLNFIINLESNEIKVEKGFFPPYLNLKTDTIFEIFKVSDNKILAKSTNNLVLKLDYDEVRFFYDINTKYLTIKGMYWKNRAYHASDCQDSDDIKLAMKQEERTTQNSINEKIAIVEKELKGYSFCKRKSYNWGYVSGLSSSNYGNNCGEVFDEVSIYEFCSLEDLSDNEIQIIGKYCEYLGFSEYEKNNVLKIESIKPITKPEF